MFESARLKIKRANKHISDLYLALQAFAEDHPCSLRTDGRYTVEPWSVTIDKPIPEEIFMIAGDAAHNLRSALDHCVWEMTKGARAGLPRNQVAACKFPACNGTRENYESSIDGVKAFNPEIREFLKNIGAYKDGPGRAIVALHNIDIEDKHAFIVSIGMTCTIDGLLRNTLDLSGLKEYVSESIPMQRFDLGNPRKVTAQTRSGPHLVHIPIGSFTRRRFPAIEFSQDYKLSLDILFSEIQPFPSEPILPSFVQLSNLVQGIINAADAGFGNGHSTPIA